jgi:hypothetical protein
VKYQEELKEKEQDKRQKAIDNLRYIESQIAVKSGSDVLSTKKGASLGTMNEIEY